MPEINYVTQFSNRILAMYEHLLTSNALYQSNMGIQIVNTKDIRLPKVKVSGYKDHNRTTMGFNGGSYSNEFETKTLDHDRDIEFGIDPMDVDETNQILSMANIQERFEKTQAIPELDCYTYSKEFAEAKRCGSLIKTEPLTTTNILADFDANLQIFEEAGVPLERVILYCTPAYKTMLKNAEGIQRTLEVSGGSKGIDRRVHSLDDINKIQVVPSTRFKSAYNFTDGCIPDDDARQMDYMLIDPEAQVSRVKYSYIKSFSPGSDSRCADKYLYQNRRFNGSFALDGLMKEGCIIHTEPEKAGA